MDSINIEVVDNYRIAVGMLIETVEHLLEGYENEDFIFLENGDFDTEDVMERLQKRIKIVRKFED